MRKLSYSLLLICFIVFGFFACNNDDNSDPNAECSTILCTTEFRFVIVNVKDSNQDAVELDSYQVINLENNEDITVSFDDSENLIGILDGSYPLVHDNSLENNSEINIRFTGFINNQQVVQSDYIVTKDCCHVSLVDGNLSLVIP